jgi:rod shape-determining protein MreC
MGDALMDFSASIHGTRSDIKGYFSLREENDSIREDNRILRERLAEVEMQIEKYQSLAGLDSLENVKLQTTTKEKPYSFIPAHIVRNTIHRNYNYLVLDKGSKDGVTKDMGVVSPQGVAGRVIRVGSNYSVALSGLNITFRLSLQALDTEGNWVAGTVGVYEWTGGDPRFAYLTSIPETAELKNNYEVVTSAHSLIFPPGYKVGKVQEMGDVPEEGFFNARIKLATDYSKLDNVYLVKSSFKASIDSLSLNLPGNE